MIKNQIILEHRFFNSVLSILRSSPYELEISDLTRMGKRLRDKGVTTKIADVLELFEMLQTDGLGTIQPPKFRGEPYRFKWVVSTKELVEDYYKRSGKKNKEPLPSIHNKTLVLALDRNYFGFWKYFFNFIIYRI